MVTSYKGTFILVKYVEETIKGPAGTSNEYWTVYYNNKQNISLDYPKSNVIFNKIEPFKVPKNVFINFLCRSIQHLIIFKVVLFYFTYIILCRRLFLEFQIN